MRSAHRIPHVGCALRTAYGILWCAERTLPQIDRPLVWQEASLAASKVRPTPTLFFLSLVADIEAVEIAGVSQVESSAGNDRMGPTAAAAFDLHPTL